MLFVYQSKLLKKELNMDLQFICFGLNTVGISFKIIEVLKINCVIIMSFCCVKNRPVLKVTYL